MVFAMLRDRFPNDQAKVLGLAVASGAFAFTIGPPVGGLLFIALGFQVPFVLAGVMPPVVLALVLLAAPKRGSTPTATDAKNVASGQERRISLRETGAWLLSVSSFRLYFPGLATAIAMAKVSVMPLVFYAPLLWLVRCA
jgi:MFS family permease|eukprot:COSAG02_NODE_5235_length_4517_cov_3.028067_7_plen_140_part_00